MGSTDTQIIRAGSVWTCDGFIDRQLVVIQGSHIAALEPWGTDLSSDWPVVDASDLMVVPGLVDLQVNGALGHSFQQADLDYFDAAIGYHLAAGTTTILPTLITAPADLLCASLKGLADYLAGSHPANLPGIHLEGPFLAPDKAGAHDPTALTLPDLKVATRFMQASGGQLKMVTLAPELPDAAAVIRMFHESGVVVAAGHSAATFAQMKAAVSAGLSMLTHAGNASDWPHRAVGNFGFMASEPGVVGSFLAIPELAGGIIMDGFHVHPALLAPIVRAKGRERVILVSDASTIAGCEPGHYSGGGLDVTVHAQGYATSGRGGGWLAGSTITLLDALRNAVRLADVSLVDAVYMATTAPARVIGVDDLLGQIRAGFSADLLLLDDELTLHGVMARGGWISGG